MPEPVLSLKSFVQRAKVRALYREALRLTRQSQDKSTQRELTDWARYEFDRHRNVQDPDRDVDYFRKPGVTAVEIHYDALFSLHLSLAHHLCLRA
ncbi:hypothetical protein BJ684DRAFT_20179 [Piptocephalis cylindrospora]|uniref:Complex 1 LYR protein domain-containing protein n=1 Tax=Piptocephalis cylindrospora TaxID=1907219 RepID=A0A4P9Y3T2_9FUNG|nr:hypothetical protein BJ684DRAFT_20179 [Piptocephalis cylindrospora]|eukprot:RKP13312.1 hypothetical protein BJ684DRAFT_20179 [Piptocephalis cylindrospora]